MEKEGFKFDWKLYVLLFLLFVFGVSMFRNLARIERIETELNEGEIELDEAIKEGEKLQARLDEVTSEIYTEREIRDRLGYAKEGEVVLIMPPADELRKLIMKESLEEERLPDPNWKRWARFLGFL